MEPATKQDIEVTRQEIRELAESNKKDIADLTGLINDLMNMMNERFDRLEARFDNLEGVVKTHGVLLVSHELRISQLESVK